MGSEPNAQWYDHSGTMCCSRTDVMYSWIHERRGSLSNIVCGVSSRYNKSMYFHTDMTSTPLSFLGFFLEDCSCDRSASFCTFAFTFGSPVLDSDLPSCPVHAVRAVFVEGGRARNALRVGVATTLRVIVGADVRKRRHLGGARPRPRCTRWRLLYHFGVAGDVSG